MERACLGPHACASCQPRARSGWHEASARLACQERVSFHARWWHACCRYQPLAHCSCPRRLVHARRACGPRCQRAYASPFCAHAQGNCLGQSALGCFRVCALFSSSLCSAVPNVALFFPCLAKTLVLFCLKLVPMPFFCTRAEVNSAVHRAYQELQSQFADCTFSTGHCKTYLLHWTVDRGPFIALLRDVLK